MNVLQSVIRTGLSESDVYHEKRGIILSNCIALVLLGALVAINISRFIFTGSIPVEYTIIGLLLFISPVVLNRFHFTKASRLLVCLAPVFFIWYVFLSQMQAREAIEPSMYSGFRIFLVAVCFVPYLLFSKESMPLLMLGTLPTFLSVVFFNNILTWLDLGLERFGLTSPDYALQPARTIIAYGIISAGCYIFHFIINRNDERNQKLVTELNAQAAEIKSQNEKLVQSELTLSHLNQNLEELVEKKIENIKKQNELLMKYAHANAHYVRGPVARILGLIQLKKVDPNLTYPWFFEKVENETNQIDTILKRISVEFNDALKET